MAAHLSVLIYFGSFFLISVFTLLF